MGVEWKAVVVATATLMCASTSNVSAQVTEDPTIGQYLLNQQMRAPGQSLPLDHWMNGFTMALGMSVVVAKMDGGLPLFCPPNGTRINAAAAEREIDSLLKRHPMQNSFPLAAMTLLAFQQAYPCQAKKR